MKDYDFYVEPCQFCISRGKRKPEQCGWCGDPDTFYKESDGRYPVDWVRIASVGYDYPFHELPHPGREYYKDGQLIEGATGLVPNGVSEKDIRTAVARNEAVNGILGLHEAGFRRTLPINKDDLDSFIAAVEDVKALSNESLDASGKVEFRTLVMDEKCFSAEFQDSLMKVVGFLRSDHVDLDRMAGRQEYSNVCEVVGHEAFHILQAVSSDFLAERFNAARRMSLLKWMIVEDFFLDREGKTKFGTDLYKLLQYHDQSSELYHDISRCFDACKKDLQLIRKTVQPHPEIGLSIIDLVEGSAFVLQKYLLNKDLNLLDIIRDESIPPVYRKAAKSYCERNGRSAAEFSLFCSCSLGMGLIPDVADFIHAPYNPVFLFDHLCNLNSKESDFFSKGTPDLNIDLADLPAFINKLGFNGGDVISEIVSTDPAADLNAFARHCLLERRISEQLLALLNHVGITPREYEKLTMLRATLSEVMEGHGDERVAAIKEALAGILVFPVELIVPLLLSCPGFALKFLFSINSVARSVTYQGGIDGEEIVADHENTLMDIVERFDSSIRLEDTFCCTEHGKVPYRQIVNNSGPECLHTLVKMLFHRDLQDMIRPGSVEYRS